jgi:protein O-mannosyl-transferase
MAPDLRRAAVVVGLVAAAVYANSLGNGFAYDDVPIIEDNRSIQTLERLPRAIVSPYWPIAAGAELALWRPVTTGFLGLQYAFSGGGPLLFHASNVVLHAAASVLLVFLLTYLMSVPAAFVAGLVFAVHPVHTEAVANVVGVAELLSTLAVLGACVIHIRGGEASTWRTSLAIGLLYLVGFGAKESAVTLPGLILLVDAARERLSLRDVPAYFSRRWRAYFVMFVVSVALLTARLEILGTVANPSAALGTELLREIPKIWTLGEIWTHYVRLWVLPLDLSSDYSPNVIPISWGWHAANIAGVSLILAILFGSWVAWRRAPLGPGSTSARAAAFGVVWFGIAISPISNTVFLSGVLLAERTLYLPSVGLAAATGWLVVRLARERPRLVPALLVVVLVLGSVRTWIRTPDWRDNSVVFTTMVRDYPHSGRSQWILGDSFFERGQISESLFAYRAAANLLDSHYFLVTHVANRLLDLGRYEGAEGLLKIAIRERPTVPRAYGQRAGVRADLGDALGTERYARISLALYPRDSIRLHILAWALATRGAWDEAVEVRARADALGGADFWQRWLYDAYLHQREGDLAGVEHALDSAQVKVRNDRARAAFDSILVRDFGGV